MLRRPANWDESKKALGDPSFMNKLLEFDKDKLDDALLKKITKGYCSNPDFTADAVGKVGRRGAGVECRVGPMAFGSAHACCPSQNAAVIKNIRYGCGA